MTCWQLAVSFGWGLLGKMGQRQFNANSMAAWNRRNCLGETFILCVLRHSKKHHKFLFLNFKQSSQQLKRSTLSHALFSLGWQRLCREALFLNSLKIASARYQITHWIFRLACQKKMVLAKKYAYSLFLWIRFVSRTLFVVGPQCFQKEFELRFVFWLPHFRKVFQGHLASFQKDLSR